MFKLENNFSSMKTGIFLNIQILNFNLNPWANYHMEIMFVMLLLILIGFGLFISITIINRSVKKKLKIKLIEQNEKIGQQTRYLEKANSELKEYTEELKQQKEEIIAQAESLENALKNLRDLNEFKEGMVGMIVHDLKNPLNIILNLSKDEQVIHSGQQMLNMVNNILDVQKYETNEMPVDLRNTELSKLAERAVRNIAFLLIQKQIHFDNYINEGLIVHADSELLERIFINLLTNAIKYTPVNGKISIDASLINEKFVKIFINDSGPGIPDALKDRVFDKFAQIIAKKSGFTRSSGLGLTFCKLAVEAHGCRIGVDSKAGEGTTFWFTLPAIISGNFQQIDRQYLDIKSVRISPADLSVILPMVEKLMRLRVFEVSEIQEIITEMKDMNIPEIESVILAIENSAYSVNQDEYSKLLDLLVKWPI